MSSHPDKTILVPHLNVEGYRKGLLLLALRRGRAVAGHPCHAVLHVNGLIREAQVYLNRLPPTTRLTGHILAPEELKAEMERMFPDPERRVEPRVALEVPVELPGRRGLTRDLSPSGVRFVTEGPLEIGRVVPLGLQLVPRHLVCLDGEVRWCRESDGGFELGARFVAVERPQRAALELTLRQVRFGNPTLV